MMNSQSSYLFLGLVAFSAVYVTPEQKADKRRVYTSDENTRLTYPTKPLMNRPLLYQWNSFKSSATKQACVG